MSYESEVLADSPVAYFRMKESSGLLQDSSGNANHATASTGTAVYSEASPIITDPSALSINFDGDPTYFTVPDHASLDVGNVFTLETWAKRPDTVTTGGVMAMMTKGSLGFQMSIRRSSAHLTMSKDDIANIALSATNTLNDTNWHHLVGTKDGSTMALYIDGVDVSAGSTFADATVESTAFPMSIGANPNGGSLAACTCHLTEMALYPTALSGARIAAHYAAAFTLTVASPVAEATASGAVPTPALTVVSTLAEAVASALAPTPALTIAPSFALATASADSPVPVLTVAPSFALATASGLEPTLLGIDEDVATIMTMASPLRW